MRLTSLAVPVLRGVQEPRLSSYPPVAQSAGDDAVKLAASAGLILDEWQQSVLRRSLGERPDGKWVTPDVAVVVSRQNGKNAILEARELAGLFLFGERLIIHTAHEMKAARVTFDRVVDLIRSTPSLQKRVKNVAYSKGDEGVELHNGNRLRFMARTGGSGRSFSADTLILDEAYNLPDHVMNALTPTLSARPNPQVWYTSSAVNQLEHPHGLTLARVRRRALVGGDPQLAYSEWSGDEAAYRLDPQGYAQDRQAWAAANPGLGIRIPEEFLESQVRRLGPTGFATEHLSVGDWPDEPVGHESVVPGGVWSELVDRMSQPRDPVSFGLSGAYDQSTATIAVSGRREDGAAHVEVVEQRRGVGWVVDRMVGLVLQHNPCAVMVDPAGSLGALILPLERALNKVGFYDEVVRKFTARDYAQACGTFLVAAVERTDENPMGGLRHQDDSRLNTALDRASTRPVAGAWVWDDRNSDGDVSALVSVTLALHGLTVYGDNDGAVNVW